jgi:hypothetical protein
VDIQPPVYSSRMDEPQQTPCYCATLPDLAAVPMGGDDGLDERVFATIERIRHHGESLWWLNLSRCNACGQNWMIAQEERIFDEYFLKRIGNAEAEAILIGRWPGDFITYERVLEIGHTFAKPCIFSDPLAGSLIWSTEDLRRDRPEITADEIARLLGVTAENAVRLLKAKIR